jgi:hypothetical protein
VPNAGQLVNETLDLLQSPGQDTDQVTTLSADITSGALTFTVTQVRSGAMGISPGVVQIDSELLYCSAVDTSGVATVEPWGRGYDGTVAVSHLAGSKVVSQPTYPRAKILDALNETILRVYPTVFAVKVTTTTTVLPSLTYDLPEDAGWVLDARWLPPTGLGYWQAVRRWRMATGGTTVLGDLGVSVDVADRLVPGQPLQFTYAAKPTQLATEADDFVAVTGLPLSMRDVIVTGAAAGTLVPSQELSRLQTASIEQQNRAALVAPAAALTSSRYLEAKFQQRLKEEEKNLRRKYPIRITRSWV